MLSIIVQVKISSASHPRVSAGFCPNFHVICLFQVDQPDGTELSCTEASSYCGLRGKLYPDKRAMGFPFDRPSRSVTSVEDFVLPNMSLTDVTIRLQNVTEPNPRNPRTN